MTEPSQKALDYAARKAGFSEYSRILYPRDHSTHESIVAHAETLDELWALKPPKTRGELFAEEMRRRGANFPNYPRIAAQMIDEGWEPEDD